CVFTSHNFAVRSRLAAAIKLPEGEKARDVITAQLAGMTPICRDSVASKNAITSPPQAVARTAPSGEKSNAWRRPRRVSQAIESSPVLQSQTSRALRSRPRFKNNRVEPDPKKGGCSQASSVVEWSRLGEGNAL